ncbi:MAG: glycosyltransferase family 2 protein [Candidatus Omnitrophica bacterium]|nr:glycosyltransferase family 2 protein [Candidatus Omnitrophota bacterium]
MRACVVIPAYNAADTLEPLVRQIKAMGLDVVVVNDGSTDRTAQAMTEAGTMLISHLANEGKGAALRSGFAFAVAAGYDAVVTMDSDGQHGPADLPPLLDAAAQSGAGIVVGDRMSSGAPMPLARRWTNRVMSCLVSALTRQRIPDSQCGLRVIRRDVLAAVRLRTRRFEIESEVLLAAARAGWAIDSVPIRAIYDRHRSHIRPLQDGVRFLRLIVRYLLP